MAALSELWVAFRASTDKFNSDLRAAQRETKEFEKQWRPTMNLVETGIKTITAAGVATVAAVGAMVKVAADYGDAIRDAGVQTGLSTEKLSGLKLMAEQNGASLEDVTSGLKFLAKNMIAATEGSDAQQRAFAKLGITTAELKAANGNLEPIMDKVMDRLKEMPMSAEKTAVQLALMGKGATKLTETMSQGSAGLKAYIDLTKLLGTEVTKEAGDAADDFNDSLNLLKQATLGYSITVGNKLIPALTEVAKFMAAATMTAKDWTTAILDMGSAVKNFVKESVGEKGMNFIFQGLMSSLPIVNAYLNDTARNSEKLKATMAALAAGQEVNNKLTDYYNDSLEQTDKNLKAAEDAAKAWAARNKEYAAWLDKRVDAMYRAQAASKRLADAEIDDLDRWGQSLKQGEEDFRHFVDVQAELRNRMLSRISDAEIQSITDMAAGLKGQADAAMAAAVARTKQETQTAEIVADIWDENFDQNVARINSGLKKQQEVAEANQRIWQQATANITSDFAKAFSDVIFHAKNFGQAMKDIALKTAESMFQAFLTGLLSPLTSAMSRLGKGISDAIFGGASSSGLLGKGLGALGGILGLGGGTAVAAMGVGTTAAGLAAGSGATASIIGVTSGLGAAGAGAGAAGAGAAAGGAGAGLGASMAALASNPITIAAAAAIAAGLAIHHFVGRGRRSADEFVQKAENPFRNSLGAIVDSFDSMKKAGSLTLEQAKTARDSATELWRSFLQSNAEFAAQGKTQAKVAEQSLRHLSEVFGPNLQKVFSGMDTAIAELKGQGGSGIPATGLANSASTRFAATIDKLIPWIESWINAGFEQRGGTQLNVTNEFSQQFTFYGVPESLQQQIRDQIIPQILADIKDNTRGAKAILKDILGL